MTNGTTDEAGPLWILFENFMDWLPFWARWTVLLGGLAFVIAVIVLFVWLCATYKKKS